MELVYFITIVIASAANVLSFDVDKGYFWQVTDFHYDANYSTAGNPNQMCHIGPSGIAYHNGIYGNYKCDAPWELVKSAISAMKSIYAKPDFILWTGDSIPHVDSKLMNEEKIYQNIGNVTLQLKEVFPNTSIYPVLGNHDYYPEDEYPDQQTDFYSKILNQSHWDKLLDTSEAEQFKKGGYYNTTTKKHLIILGLNTNLYYSMDKATSGKEDPAGQFDWLETQLKRARLNNQKVWIVSHVPPGEFELVRNIMWFYPEYNERYLNIMKMHSESIAAHIYGHEHTDSFRVLRDNRGEVEGSMFLSPAVTPWKSTLPGVGSNNPSIRLYEYNQRNGDIINYKQYFLNLSDANSVKTANWTLEYDFVKDYNVSNLSPHSLFNLAESFKSDSKKFNKYLQYNTVSQDLNPQCNHTCLLSHVCAITEVEKDPYTNCLENHHTTPHHGPTKPHHHPIRPVPRYMYYIIGALGALVFILFIAIALVCVSKRRHVVPPRYSRFSSSSIGHGPIN